MIQQPASPTNLTLNDVKRHFEHWRATREKRCKIPDFLWDEVKSLIGRYPTNQITKTLRVNAYQISAGINNKNKPDITLTVTLRASEFQILMAQGDPMKAAIPEDWHPVQITYAASAKTEGKLS